MKNQPFQAVYQSFSKARFALPSEAEVADLEHRLGIDLPPDYRQFLLDYNGGFFRDPEIAPPVDECPTDCLNSLYGIHATHRSAELGSNVDLFDDNDPPEILPIGYTLMGSLLLLVTHPEDNGTIAMKVAYSDDTYRLADGIAEFFSLLRKRKS